MGWIWLKGVKNEFNSSSSTDNPNPEKNEEAHWCCLSEKKEEEKFPCSSYHLYESNPFSASSNRQSLKSLYTSNQCIEYQELFRNYA
uniref:Ovule protein n=1 Tax=Panagrellus redivivus TaxID=6233 RepID=A0A7E4UTG7_PANRE